VNGKHRPRFDVPAEIPRPHPRDRAQLAVLCSHRGPATGETFECQQCTRKTSEPVFACALHGRCTPDRLPTDPGIRICSQCPDLLHPSVPEIWPGLADPLDTPELTPVPEGWGRRRDVVVRHIAAFRQLLRTQLPPSPALAGDGIVLCGGGKYWPGVVVAVKMLRDSGSTLPVQIWHRADEQVNPADVDGLNVRLRNASEIAPPPRILRGWEIKTLAILHSGWRRVIYLDADAYPVASPEPLLTLLDRAPFVFWEDLPNFASKVQWHGFGLEPSAVGQIQGGQLLIDVERFFRPLLLAHWLNQHSDWSYQWAYGDQDQYRVVLAATGAPHLNLGPAPWKGLAFVCEHERQAYFVHRCRAKMFLPEDVAAGDSESNRQEFSLPKEKEAWQHFDRLADSRGVDAARIFGLIYERGAWGSPRSSGNGSSDPESAPFLDAFHALATVAHWRSVVDLGCGDGRVTRQLKTRWVAGVDCYLPHLERLATEVPEIQWHLLDLDRDRERLPPGEVAILRDVLHHWPEALILDWLSWAWRSERWSWILVCQDNQQKQRDCRLGGYRGLDPARLPLCGFPWQKVCDYQKKSVLLLRCQ
jgi:hypothetical protein